MKSTSSLRSKRILFFALIAILALPACKKSGTPEPTKGAIGVTGTTGVTGNTGATGPTGTPEAKVDTDVYIGGSVTTIYGKLVAAYWKNGVLNKLSDSTLYCNGSGIALYNNNVFVCGYYSIGDQVPAYWKNDSKNETRLAFISGDTSVAYANGIAVNSNGVYVAGEIDGTKGFSAVYWKDNDLPVNLAHKAGASSVVLTETGVNVAGGIYSTTIGKKTSAEWENGSLQTSNDQLDGYGNAIALNGSDIFTAGRTTLISTGKLMATYWKYGYIHVYLTDGSTNAEANAIALKDNVVYTAGYITNANGKNVACYWKDDKPTTLGDGNINSYATGIAVIGNDVYVSGYSVGGSVYTSMYWKNSKIKTLNGSGAYSYTNGIIVKTHPH